MMAELVAGAFVGAALNEVILVLNRFKHSDEILHELLERLERLKPMVESTHTKSGSPADKWFHDLYRVLQEAQNLAVDCRGSAKRMLKSGKLVRINRKISELLDDSNAIQLKMQVELQKNIAQILSFASSEVVKEKELKQLTSQLEWSTHTINDVGSSSSTSSPMKPQWSRASEIPDPPDVTFGAMAVVDEQIKDILQPETYRKWIVFWGMGGVGKTFTADKLFHDSSIKQHFTGGTYWVTVSKDQPPPHHILKQLCTKIPGGRASEFSDDVEAARSKVRSLLDKGRILLVLDDVWQARTLDYLDVISEDSMGVILITTRDRGILKYESRDGVHLKRIVDCAKVVEIPRLSTVDAWHLFSWHAFGIYRKGVPQDLESVGREVAEECKGLPLALRVIGSTMGRIQLSTDDILLGRSLPEEWKKALEQLRSMSEYKDEYESLYEKLQWSVENLVSQDARLKDCFFYFGAYPEDYEISVGKLVSIWAAEGLCGKEEAKSLLGSLVAKSMIELTDRGAKCKIHDVMRDLVHRNLKFRGRQEIPIFQRQCLYAPGLDLDTFPDDWTAPGVQLYAERLSVQYTRLEKLPDQFNAPHLRVLMLAQTIRISHRIATLAVPLGFFQNLSYLKVLVLSGTGVRQMPRSVLRSLKSLVLLDLSHCSTLMFVSDELDRLQNLETILLEGCWSLQRLPRLKSLTKLQTLTVTIAGRHESGLKSLKEDAYGLRQVFQLHNLRRLFICGWADSFWRRLPDMASLSARKETITGFVRRTFASQRSPVSLMGLRNLRVIQLYRTDDVSLPAFDKLPLLEALWLLYCEKIESLPESFGQEGAFPCLKKLTIHMIPGLKKLFTFNAGTMPKLEILSLGNLGNSEGVVEFPVSLRRLTTLKSLCMDESSFREPDFNTMFREPDCFPNLERLTLSDPANAGLPQHILERHTLGQLRVAWLTGADFDHTREFEFAF